MLYLYNEKEKCFVIYTNFKPKQIPKGYKKITEEQYNELIETLNKENENKEEE